MLRFEKTAHSVHGIEFGYGGCAPYGVVLGALDNSVPEGACLFSHHGVIYIGYVHSLFVVSNGEQLSVFAVAVRYFPVAAVKSYAPSCFVVAVQCYFCGFFVVLFGKFSSFVVFVVDCACCAGGGADVAGCVVCYNGFCAVSV